MSERLKTKGELWIGFLHLLATLGFLVDTFGNETKLHPSISEQVPDEITVILFAQETANTITALERESDQKKPLVQNYIDEVTRKIRLCRQILEKQEFDKPRNTTDPRLLALLRKRH